MTGWRLLLTRPAEESAALACELSSVGIYSSSLPLLSIQPLALTGAQRALIAHLDRYCAVIVVSKPAARLGLALVSQYWPQPPTQKWFSVGVATAQILTDYGLDVSYPQSADDSEALLALPVFGHRCSSCAGWMRTSIRAASSAICCWLAVAVPSRWWC